MVVYGNSDRVKKQKFTTIRWHLFIDRLQEEDAIFQALNWPAAFLVSHFLPCSLFPFEGESEFTNFNG
jgi:hypothetical protein